MTVTCPVCKRKFHKGKTPEFRRLSKHMWKDHSDYMKRKIKSGKRKAKKEDVLLDELQFTDDMILQSLMNAGIPINYPQQQQMLNPYQPTQHQSIAGTLITAYKLGMTAYTTAKGIQKGVKAIKRRRTKK